MGEFLGHALKGRVVAASSPATESVSNVLACEKGGAAAVILKSASSTRLGDGIKRSCHLDDTGFWAASGFDREILPLGLAERLVSKCVERASIPVCASLTELTLDPAPWLSSCEKLQRAGAHGIQLDFFYIENLLGMPGFTKDFKRLLKDLLRAASIPIIPKINIAIPAQLAASLLTDVGATHVSILDSIRTPAPVAASNMEGSVSVFGHFMFPLTRQYVTVLSKAGLNVTAGGGVRNGADASELIRLGAQTVQVATEVLLHGYQRFAGIENSIVNVSPTIEFSTTVPSTTVSPNPKKKKSNIIFKNLAHCTGCGACRVQTFCNKIKYQQSLKDCDNCQFCVNLCQQGAIQASECQ